MTTKLQPKIIHIAKIYLDKSGINYLFLRQLEPYRYVWFWKKSIEQEEETPIWGGAIEEAILAGRKRWKENEFRIFNCGFRYTLPERDEVGTNALFHQMMASYDSMTGVYFDEELGSNCIVHNASLEARNFAKKLQQDNVTKTK